jgi:hypothetical protein
MNMTLDDHIESAKEIKEAVRLIRSVQNRTRAYPKSHRLSKLLSKITSRDILAIKNILDIDYHNGITDSQFKELGHIYYGVDNV